METIAIANTTEYPLGALVETTEQIGPNPSGSRGIVYESVADGDTFFASIITEDGNDLGALSEIEANYALIVIGQSSLHYQFSTPSKLMTDFKNGIFSAVFKEINLPKVSLI